MAARFPCGPALCLIARYFLLSYTLPSCTWILYGNSLLHFPLFDHTLKVMVSAIILTFGVYFQKKEGCAGTHAANVRKRSAAAVEKTSALLYNHFNQTSG